MSVGKGRGMIHKKEECRQQIDEDTLPPDE